MSCKCHIAKTSSSGGSSYSISDFTSNCTTHYSYSNWDVYIVFTCDDCGINWFIQSDFVDRPPYINRAYEIPQQEVDNINRWEYDKLNKLIEDKGLRVIFSDILKGAILPDSEEGHMTTEE